MEIQQFHEVLAGFVAGSQAQESTEIIQNLIDTKYATYIELLMNTIQQIDNPQIFDVAVALMDIEVKNKRIFANPDLAVEIISGLTPLVANIIQSQNVRDNFKKIMAYILAQSHIFIYHSINNTDIPTYILTMYNQMPEIRKYLVYCLYEIAFNDPDYGGFNIEDLVTIVVDSSDDESLYMPRLNLFFSIAMRNVENQDLQKIFPNLFMACPESQLKDMLHSVAGFSEHSASFFQPCLGPLVQRLCGIAQNQAYHELIRDSSMHCLTAIAEGAVEMCQSSQEFYEPVFATLLQVAAEIDDSAPWGYEEDLNNTSPYQCALDSIAIIFDIFQNPNIFIPFYGMIMNILSQEEVPWQTAFASISALGEINFLAMNSIFESNTEAPIQKSLYERLSMFLDIECHPRTRVAMCNFISKLSQHGILFPLVSDINPYTQILIEPLESMMVAEDNLQIKKIAYQAYTQFISQLTSQKTSIYFKRLFPELVNELSTRPESFRIYIVRLIGPIVKLARDDAIDDFQSIFKISHDLLKSKDPNICAEAIRCFSLTIPYFPDKKRIIRLCLIFLKFGINLLSVDTLNEETLDHLYEAIHNLIISIGKYVEPIVPHIVPKIIINCQKPISIEESNSLEVNDYLNMKSNYLRISPGSSLVKIFANRNEVTEVEHALLILEAFIYSDPNFRNYLDEVYTIINNWLTNKFSIEPLQNKCWTLLETLSIIFDNEFSPFEDCKVVPPDKQAQYDDVIQNSVKLIQTIFRCYIINIEKRGSPILMSIMLKVTSNAISFANKLKWIDVDLFTAILQTIQPLINDLFSMKEKKIREMQEFTAVDLSDKSISHYDNCLSNISELISYCFDLQPELTKVFYKETIEPKTGEYLQNDLTKIFGITTTCYYIIYTKDSDNMLPFCEQLIAYSGEFERPDDLPLTALSSLGKLLYEFPFSNLEIILNFMGFFVEYFKSDQMQIQDDHTTMISDFANVAFAKFIIKNKGFLTSINPDYASDIANSFLDAGPLWEDCEDSDIYFQCLEGLLRDRSIMRNDVCGINWPDFTLGQIITGFITHSFYEETRIKFAQTLRREYSTPEGKQSIDETLERLKKNNRADFFISLIALPEERGQN